MPSLEERVQEWFSLGVTVLYAFVAILALAIPTFALADIVVGRPLRAGVPVLAIVGAAFGTTFYVREVFSLARLGQYAFTAFGAALAWVLVIGSVLHVTDVALEPRDPLAIAVAWLLALCTAAYVVYVSENPAFA